MITIHVSAVLAVRDGFTGRPVARNAVQCFINGARCMPEYREGGYFVFVDLAPGAYRVTLKGAFYQNETVEFVAACGMREERIVSLKPAHNYPFGGGVALLQGIVTERGKAVPHCVVYLAAQLAVHEIKIAQDQAEAGASSLRIYCRNKSIALPAEYLIIDGKNTEVCTLNACSDEMGKVAAPLRYGHKRGKAMYPAIRYMTDESGTFMAAFRECGKVLVFCPDKRHVEELCVEGEKTSATIAM